LDHVYLNVEDPGIKITRITLLNTTGSLVRKIPFTGTMTGPMKIDLNGFSAGIYYLRIDTETGTNVKKVVIME
jgi:hypothetical protein